MGPVRPIQRCSKCARRNPLAHSGTEAPHSRLPGVSPAAATAPRRSDLARRREPLSASLLHHTHLAAHSLFREPNPQRNVARKTFPCLLGSASPPAHASRQCRCSGCGSDCGDLDCLLKSFAREPPLCRGSGAGGFCLSASRPSPPSTLSCSALVEVIISYSSLCMT